MLMQGLVGQPSTTSIAPNTQTTLRQGQLADLIVSELHGRYYEQAYRQNLFWGGNTAATAISVALATTYTGLCLSNPAGNTKNLVLLKLNFVLSVAEAAIAPLLLATGYNSAGIVTHTTPLIGASTLIGTGPTPTGKVDAACTLVGTPAYTMPILGGAVAAAFPSQGPAVLDLEGTIIIPPGGWAAIAALTAVTGFGGMIWEEVPV